MTSTYVDTSSVRHTMLHALAENWWLFLLRGLCAIVFGMLAFVWPRATLLTLVLLYGAFALVDGVAAILAAIKGGEMTSRWWLAVLGAFSIAAGGLTLYWPVLTALVLLLFIAFWAIATGIVQIIGGIRLRKEIDGEWLLIVGGVLHSIRLAVADPAGNGCPSDDLRDRSVCHSARDTHCGVLAPATPACAWHELIMRLL